MPAWVSLGKSGRAWWKWAWRTPQSAAWSAGDLGAVARRASLEDDLAVMESVDSLDIVLEDVADAETAAQIKAIVGKLASIVTGRMGIAREITKLDIELGLTPKGMAALRWKIVGDAPLASVKTPDFTAAERRKARAAGA